MIASQNDGFLKKIFDFKNVTDDKSELVSPRRHVFSYELDKSDKTAFDFDDPVKPCVYKMSQHENIFDYGSVFHFDKDKSNPDLEDVNYKSIFTYSEDIKKGNISFKVYKYFYNFWMLLIV